VVGAAAGDGYAVVDVLRGLAAAFAGVAVASED